MVAIWDEVFERGFRYLSVTVIGRAHFPNTFDIVEIWMNFLSLSDSVAHAVCEKEVDVTADATKRIL